MPLELPVSSLLRSHGIQFAGVSDLVDGYFMRSPSGYDQHLLTFTIAGRGYWRSDNRQYDLQPGEAIFYAAGSGATDFGVAGERWSMIWFYLDPAAPWEVAFSSALELKVVEFMPQLEFSMRNFILEAKRDGQAARHYAELIVHYLRVFFKGNDNDSWETFQNLWNEVAAHPEQGWDKRKLAKELKMSVSTLQRYCRKYYGKSPHRLIVENRMKQAMLLLVRSDLPLRFLADKIGYSDEFSFSAAFKQFTGESPREYRQRMKKMTYLADILK